MAGGVNALGNLLGKVNANNALVVTLDGGAAVATTLAVDTIKLDSTNQDVILERDAANTPAFRNGTNAQTFRVYNTFTDASNYERVNLEWFSNVFSIQQQRAGTGTTRVMRFGVASSSQWEINTNGDFVGLTATAGLGYTAGAGGAVTQLTNKSTGVTLNTVTGEITMNAASLAANTNVAFVLTNSTIAAGDYVMVQHVSGGTAGAYNANALAAAGSATINVKNNTAGALLEAAVIKFVVFKAATA